MAWDTGIKSLIVRPFMRAYATHIAATKLLDESR